MLKLVPSTRLGSALQISVAGVAAAGALFWAGVAAVSGGSSATDDEVAFWLSRAGLDPAALAVSCVPHTAVDEVVAGARGHLETGLQGLVDAETAVASAQAAAASLERLVQTGQASPQQIAALPGAHSALADARAAMETRRAALFAAAADPLETAQEQRLSAFRTARLQGWDLPLKYLPMEQTEAQRIALRGAPAHMKTAERYGLEVAASATTTINTANADAAVVAAGQGLATLDAVTEAWNEAVFE